MLLDFLLALAVELLRRFLGCVLEANAKVLFRLLFFTDMLLADRLILLLVFVGARLPFRLRVVGERLRQILQCFVLESIQISHSSQRHVCNAVLTALAGLCPFLALHFTHSDAEFGTQVLQHLQNHS